MIAISDVMIKVLLFFVIAFVIAMITFGRRSINIPFMSASHPIIVIITEKFFVHVLWKVTMRNPMTRAMIPPMYRTDVRSMKSSKIFL